MIFYTLTPINQLKNDCNDFYISIKNKMAREEVSEDDVRKTINELQKSVDSLIQERELTAKFKRASRIQETRIKFIEATLDYLVALGFIPESIERDKELIQELSDYLYCDESHTFENDIYDFFDHVLDNITNKEE